VRVPPLAVAKPDHHQPGSDQPRSDECGAVAWEQLPGIAYANAAGLRVPPQPVAQPDANGDHAAADLNRDGPGWRAWPGDTDGHERAVGPRGDRD
jgi:hypothetical protein